MTFDPNSVQYGGDHYTKAGGNQHWDMLPACGYGWEYYTGRAAAYVTRIKDPGLDGQKAGHFIDKLLWLIDNRLVPATYEPTQTPRVHIATYLRTVYFPANGISQGSQEAQIISELMHARTRVDLVGVRQLISLFEQRLLRTTRPLQQQDPVITTASDDYPFAETAAVVAAGAAAVAYANQDPDPATPAFASGRGGDFAGAGAEATWEAKEDKPAPADDSSSADNRVFVLDGSTSDVSTNTCSKNDYPAEPSTSSSGATESASAPTSPSYSNDSGGTSTYDSGSSSSSSSSSD